MKNFFALIFLIIFVSIAAIFFVAFNTKVALINKDSVKGVIKEANFYDIAAAYIKDDIVKKSGLSVDEGANFEKLNQDINGKTVQPVIDKTIDNVFLAIESGSDTMTFPIIFKYGDKNLSFQKTLNLNNNLAFVVLKNINLILIVLGTLAIFILGLILLMADGFRSKFIWLGSALIGISIVLVLAIYLLSSVVPTYISNFTNKIQFFEDPKLINGLNKAISVALSKESFYFTIEFISALVIGFLLIFLASTVSKEKSSKSEDKLDKIKL
jgi:hypothetical protein